MKAVRTGSVAALMLWVLPGLTGTALAAGKVELRGIGQFEIPGWFKNSFLDTSEDVTEAAHNAITGSVQMKYITNVIFQLC